MYNLVYIYIYIYHIYIYIYTYIKQKNTYGGRPLLESGVECWDDI